MLDHKIFSKWKIDEIEENLKNNLNLVCLLERPILDNKSLRIAEEYAIQAHKKYKDKYNVDTEWIYVDNKFEILDKEDIMAEIKRKIMRRPVLERYCLS